MEEEKYVWLFFKNILDVRKTTWYFIFGKNGNYFKGKPVERQGRKARRG